MTSKIYFDAVFEMNKYSNYLFDLEHELKPFLLKCETPEDEIELIINNCLGFLKINDLKVALALIYNYMPSSGHVIDYEITAMYLLAVAKGCITKRDFIKAQFY